MESEQVGMRLLYLKTLILGWFACAALCFANTLYTYRPAKCLTYVVDPIAGQRDAVFSISLEFDSGRFFPELLEPQFQPPGYTPKSLLRWTLMHEPFVRSFHWLTFGKKEVRHVEGGFVALLEPGAVYDFVVLENEMIVAKVPRLWTTAVMRKHLILSNFGPVRMAGSLGSDRDARTLWFSNHTGSFLSSAKLLTNTGLFLREVVDRRYGLRAVEYTKARKEYWIPTMAAEAEF